MKTLIITAIVAALMVVAVLLLGNNYILRLVTNFAMFGALALAWSMIGGFTGYPSFATAAFFGLGAYAAGIAQTHGLSIVVSWAFAACFASITACIIGFSILHLKGHYFAVASFLLVEVLREVATSWTDLTGGGMGLSLPRMAVDARTEATIYLLAMVGVAIGAASATQWLRVSRLGLSLVCIAQNEAAAQVIGIHTKRAKVLAFAMSSFFVGACGAVYGSWTSYIDPIDVFDISLSVEPIVMALIGGPGTVLGPLLGAAIFLVIEETVWRNLLNFHSAALGLLVLAVVLMPNLKPTIIGLLAHLRPKQASTSSGASNA